MTFDFLYLPLNVSGRANLGCAFVNFSMSASAASFHAEWHRRRLPSFEASKRRMSIGVAKVQGLEANVWEIRSKSEGRTRRPETLAPFVLQGGRRVSLEEFEF